MNGEVIGADGPPRLSQRQGGHCRGQGGVAQRLVRCVCVCVCVCVCPRVRGCGCLQCTWDCSKEVTSYPYCTNAMQLY